MKYTLPQKLTRSFSFLYKEVASPHVMVTFDQNGPSKYLILFSFNENMQKKQRLQQCLIGRIRKDLLKVGCNFTIDIGRQVKIELQDEKDVFLINSKFKQQYFKKAR